MKTIANDSLELLRHPRPAESIAAMTAALRQQVGEDVTITHVSSTDEISRLRRYRNNELRSSAVFRVEELDLAFDVVADWGVLDPQDCGTATAPTYSVRPLVLFHTFLPAPDEATLVQAIARAQAYKQQLIDDGTIRPAKRRWFRFDGRR